MKLLLAALVVSGMGLVACSDDGDGSGSPDAGSSGGSGGMGEPLTGFDKIYADTIARSCLGPACHTTAVGGNLVMTSADAAYDALVDQPASSVHECGGADGGVAWTRVVPGNPDESLLYQKLSNPAPCGVTMPVSETAELSDAQKEEIRAWIADGAARE